MQDVDLKAALDGLQSDNAKTRDSYYFSLLALSESDPRRLYPFWDVFVDLLRAPEVSKKFAAIHLLSNVMEVDEEGRFEVIFEDFYGLLAHESPVVSPHVAGASGKILQAKPHLAERIVPLLLGIDKTGGCRHPELMKSYVIQAFDEAFEMLPPAFRTPVIQFVQGQEESDSPKTRKAAKAFLARWNPLS